jgi:hypothetical protein
MIEPDKEQSVTTDHKASCLCGQLSLTGEGEPDFVIACNCLACQKRTGAVFGTGAYYRRNRISISGEHKTYQRTAETGRKLVNHFCPACGTTLYWSLEMRPDHLGIGIGSFADPSFAAPMRAIWTENKHHWVRFPEDMPMFEKAVPES